MRTDGWSPFSAVGFLNLADGVFQPDSSAGSTLPPGGVQAPPTPGGTKPWWDARVGRWVPVPLSLVSPDGQTYAFYAIDGIHQVVVTSGTDTLLVRRPEGVLGGEVLGYLAGALYVVYPSAVKNGSGGGISNPPDQVGVFRIDLATRVTTRVFDSDSLGVMATGALWSAGTQLTRVDLITGQRANWFTNPTEFMQFLGVDGAGLPLIWTFNGVGHLDIWHLDAPNQPAKIYSLDYTGSPHIFGPERQQGLFVADEHGIWFGAADGLWLYDGSTFRQVSSVSGIPAGPCQ